VPRSTELTPSPNAKEESQRIHVVAAVVTDVRGRVLLARRTAGRDLAGAWEFPGGKVDPGETAFQALERELHEELGIRIDAVTPLIAVPQAYPSKRLVLDVYRVDAYRGKPQGREKQALAWSPLEKLATYPMPPADRPVVALLMQPDRYLVTPDAGPDRKKFLQGVERALAAGIRRIQLRTGPRDDLPDLAAQVQSRCAPHDAQLLINADIALARKLKCGVHLRASQLTELRERPLPKEQPVAASCHDEAELRLAEALDVDFVVLGPVAATPSHPDRAPLGWKQFAALRETVSLPIYALGGMAITDLHKARRHGAQGIAAIRGLWQD
jgi:8-oxo-dGTP diphosphatase